MTVAFLLERAQYNDQITNKYTHIYTMILCNAEGGDKGLVD